MDTLAGRGCTQPATALTSTSTRFKTINITRLREEHRNPHLAIPSGCGHRVPVHNCRADDYATPGSTKCDEEAEVCDTLVIVQNLFEGWRGSDPGRETSKYQGALARVLLSDRRRTKNTRYVDTYDDVQLRNSIGVTILEDSPSLAVLAGIPSLL